MRFATMIGPILLLAAAGCEKTDPLFCSDNPGATGCPMVDGDATGDDMSMDDMAPGIDARVCFGASTGTVCLAQPPAGPLIFTNVTTFDTTEGVSTNPVCLPAQPSDWMTAGQPDACFIVGTSIQINANLNVVGERPLVLVSSTTITVNAILDVASHPGKRGPGAPDDLCKAFTTEPGGDTNGGGGGAGGSFMSQGAPGGDGDNGNQINGVAAAAEGVNPAVLRAGCNGQQGGFGQNAGNGGLGGLGGGAVYLLAGDGITLMAGSTINASGAGAALPGRQAGGGGGGSGGMIMLYAPSITSAGATLMANGGGGSSGGDDSGAGNGEIGNDPTDPMSAAAGGSGNDGAGDGGDGFFHDTEPRAATAGTVGDANRGGGGGGGGRGWIQANVDLTATSSPAPVTIP